jgi:hypothetical protein
LEGGEVKYSRQKVTQFCEKNAGARLGGYVLEQIKDTLKTRPVSHYKLRYEKREGA